MKMKLLSATCLLAFTPLYTSAQVIFNKQWSFQGLSEIVAFDKTTDTLWVAGVTGVNVINRSTGSFIGRIDTSSFGSVNSVAIHNGVAAFAIEAPTRTNPSIVQFYDTATRTLSAGNNNIAVGALPDMLTFTPNGGKLLVANEGTPTTYGTRIGGNVPGATFNAPLPGNDPVGSVSIINMSTRTVEATPTLLGVPQFGNNIRTGMGMDFEPESIAVSRDGSKAFVSLQEANSVGVLNLNTNTFDKVVGLGLKDFSIAGNEIVPKTGGVVTFANYSVKGLYMPDGMASYQSRNRTMMVMANEGDYREDDADRLNVTASNVGPVNADLVGMRISNRDSIIGNPVTAGGRSFSIRDADGNLVYDSGSILDREAHKRGIYDDGRSRDKGVEPEGVELMEMLGRTFAFIGLERTTKGAVAIFDITDAENSRFIDMIVTDGDLSPEGLKGFMMDGKHYLAIANEGNGNTNLGSTTLYQLHAVPEPETYAMLLAGLGSMGFAARRRMQK